MAENLGISLTAYSLYEAGSREPKLAGLKLISQLLDVRVDDLLRDFNENKDKDTLWIKELASKLELETSMRIQFIKDDPEHLLVINAGLPSFATGANLHKENYTWRKIPRDLLFNLYTDAQSNSLHVLSQALKVHFCDTEKEFYSNKKEQES